MTAFRAASARQLAARAAGRLSRARPAWWARPSHQSIDRRVEEVRAGLVVSKRLGARLVKRSDEPIAISVPEMCAVASLLAFDGTRPQRIAELGTYLGHTANLLGELSHPRARIEVYDLFEHNASSRRLLADHPLYDPDSFYEIWRSNTEAHQHKIELFRGDLNQTKGRCNKPLDLLFVDIVKHSSLVNTVVDPFYDRLRVGGFLLHQDYYHWQSPWLVYQMEMLSSAFALVGDFGNNMAVYVKRRALTDAERNFDYVGGLSNQEQYELFDRAIDRHPGLRAGYLKVSKLRLAIEDPAFDDAALTEQILEEFHHNERICTYVRRVNEERLSIADQMW